MGMSAHAALSGAAMRIYFYAAAAMLGIGFGMIFPAYNTLFVNLARNNQRGTASSTYMTAWDIGIGNGLLLGGYLSGVIGLGHVYLIGSASCVCSLMVFVLYAAPHFKKTSAAISRQY
jgi:predicted MFS family arabinose efflux permease